MAIITKLNINDKIISKTSPEWGIWRIIKIPTPQEDWYEKRGESGENILFKDELRFWDLVE